MPIPDQELFPHATGDAGMLVAKHQDPQDVIFFAGWFCPYVQRSWIALEEKGIDYQYKETNPYKKEKQFLDINPKGLVPAIKYKGEPLYESLVICEFFEDMFPEKPRLLPSNPVMRAAARIWIDHANRAIVPAFQRLLPAADPIKQAELLEEFYVALRKFANKVKGPYFLGENFSLVDVTIAPWIMRDYVLQKHRGYKREEASEEWARYASLVEKRESVLATQSETQHLDFIYGRYLRDEAQSEAAKAVRAGRAIP